MIWKAGKRLSRVRETFCGGLEDSEEESTVANSVVGNAMYFYLTIENDFHVQMLMYSV
jgi:hypothetical protein